jgi:hypothetical protein
MMTPLLLSVIAYMLKSSGADREIIDHPLDVLDDPHLNKALGLPQRRR